MLLTKSLSLSYTPPPPQKKGYFFLVGGLVWDGQHDVDLTSLFVWPNLIPFFTIPCFYIHFWDIYIYILIPVIKIKESILGFVIKEDNLK